MLFDDTYKTVSGFSQGSYREKGSKFIAFVYPLNSEEAVKERLAQMRKEYFDARHHCYAYCLGFDKSAYRINDDGEPSGSAGRPIYGQIQSNDLTNVLIVVIRYFGGVKLGIPGLINAYKTATREAIEANTIVTLTVNEIYQLDFEYPSLNDVMKILKDESAAILTQDFDNACRLTFSIRKASADKIISKIRKIERVSFVFLGIK